MFTLSNFILVGIGAAIGAWLRWLITYFFTIADPTLPHGTLAVNLIGGLIIGMVEIFGAGYISGEYKDVFAFIILISVLYFKPTGIMGENIDDTRV